ncbi:YD repeat-containing protein [Tenacibaculum skagerrakense]|uniref:YD repeat-containing protein n=1 Tax=Tenacibaculum skagerrakense TaxID=186571 RepID=A0A4R2NNI3_9FLAO|nr:hypothetical protein [Tenacibaculum skagerrakense]TCP23323.1 YD repeat-containing protein [Tenacibaculum skagerrakense]
MKKLMLSIILMLVCSVGYSQLTGEDGSGGSGSSGSGQTSQGNFLPEVVPPSPEAAALSRFTEVPVSHYSGLANVSIPIHTIATKGIQIPISLSYHGRGVKVSEIAPRTGMGWSLTYGGDISRQVRGNADDVGTVNGTAYLGNASDFINVPQSFTARENFFSRESVVRNYDYYPDQFTFSGGGTSGKFVFDYETLKPVVQSFGDVKVIEEREVESTGEKGKIIAFKMIDASGNTFYYGISKDRQRKARDLQFSSIGTSYYLNNAVRDGSSGTVQYYSSWKLLDIETPYGELISYHYEKERIVRHEKSYDKHDLGLGTSTNLGDMDNILTISSKVNRVDEEVWQLSKITYNQGSIVLVKETNVRQDYEGFALDKIAIFDQNNTKVKAFDLNYKYTTSTDYSNVLPQLTQLEMFPKSLKRMFLSSIEEEGNNGAKLPPYKFTYNSTVLPSRFSSRQDYWGYYNGAENNGPFLRLFEYGHYKPNRRVHLENSKAGILEQIKYPTGGITKFTYEHNTGAPPSFINEVVTPAINPESEVGVKIELTKSDFYDSSTGTYKVLNYDLPAGVNITYKLECFHLRDANGDPNIPDCIFQVLKDGYEMEIGKEVSFKLCQGSERVSFQTLVPRHPSVPIDLHLNPDYDFKLTISYDQPIPLLYSSGKRIKKIEYITENDTRLKEFDYTKGGNDTGIVIGLPSYLLIDKYNSFNSCSNVIAAYFDQTSAFSSYQPNSIGYSFVTEYNGTKNNNDGKIEYYFTNLPDGGGDYYEFPYHPPTDNEWLRGKNVNTLTYSNNPSKGYTLEKEVITNYLYGDRFYGFNAVGGTLTYPDFKFNPPAEYLGWREEKVSLGKVSNSRTLFKLPLFMYKRREDYLDQETAGLRVYYLTGGTVNLHSTTERNYFDGKVLESETKYFYDYPKHYQLQRTEITDSKGDVYKTENGFDPILMNANRMQPVTTTSYKNTTKLGVQHTEYAVDTESGILLPKKIQTSKGNQTFVEDRAIFHSYDRSGNPVEVSKKDGSKIYYVWGYDKTQPIAKIEGYSSISTAQQSAIDAAIASSNNDIDTTSENSLRSSLTALRNAFPEAQVTTYTYDPLIGITSITDPRGEVMYYEYDEFNRLRFVKNTQGQILKEHTYNYKN